MGHFYSENISKVMVELFNEEDRETLSIAEIKEALKSRGETLHSAEGQYEDDYMLSMGIEILMFGYEQHYRCVVPYPETHQQETILAQYLEDCSDFEEEEYSILDSIMWGKVDDIPVIDYVET